MDELPATTSPKEPGRRWARSVGLIAAGVIAGGVLAGAVSAGAQSSSPSSSATTGHDKWGGAGETALTGTTAQKVTAAAQAAVPGGTVLRVETDSDGSPYEVHVRKSDGTEVTVKVDKSFKVTSIETCRHGGPGSYDSGQSA
jgi:hypothetical protein